jgi:hypothetical protein
LLGAPNFTWTPEITRMVAVACTTAAARLDGAGGAENDAAAAAASRIMDVTANALRRKW